MSEYTFSNTVGELLRFPLSKLSIKHGDNLYNFFQISDNSSINIEPIFRQTHYGRQRRIGWNVELNINILQNKLFDRSQGNMFTYVVPDEDNIGNGTLTLGEPILLSGAKKGIYTVLFTTDEDFEVTYNVGLDDAEFINGGTVGVLFEDEVKFTITQGATEFVEADRFDIHVIDMQDSGLLKHLRDLENKIVYTQLVFGNTTDWDLKPTGELPTGLQHTNLNSDGAFVMDFGELLGFNYTIPQDKDFGYQVNIILKGAVKNDKDVFIRDLEIDNTQMFK